MRSPTPRRPRVRTRRDVGKRCYRRGETGLPHGSIRALPTVAPDASPRTSRVVWKLPGPGSPPAPQLVSACRRCEPVRSHRLSDLYEACAARCVGRRERNLDLLAPRSPPYTTRLRLPDAVINTSASARRFSAAAPNSGGTETCGQGRGYARRAGIFKKFVSGASNGVSAVGSGSQAVNAPSRPRPWWTHPVSRPRRPGATWRPWSDQWP